MCFMQSFMQNSGENLLWPPVVTLPKITYVEDHLKNNLFILIIFVV